MNFKRMSLAVLSAGVFALGAVGCKPQTPAQKIEDKAEDVGHEINQGVERARENAQEATKE